MLHYYNFGIHGLKWLAEVRDHLVSVLCPGIVERKHILRLDFFFFNVIPELDKIV